MDLIYMNSSKEDVGVMKDFTFDLAFGSDENNFECEISKSKHCCENGYFLYIEGTEYGGVIDKIQVDTETETVKYMGRTWHGILEKKILEPDSGEDYLILSGDANDVLAEIIERTGLEDIFSTPSEESGIEIVSYKVNRYADAYSAIRKMFFDAAGKLHLEFKGNHVELSCIPYIDYSDHEEWDSTQLEFKIEKNFRPVNHLICLGSGELKNRHVIHLFTDENGGILPYATTDNPMQDSDYILDKSQQMLFGEDEVCEVYDLGNSGSAENYIPLAKQPSKWSKRYGNYYMQTDDDKYEALAAETEVTYTLQTSQPSKWSKKYGSYFTKSGSNYLSVEAVATDSYKRQTKQPSDWKKKYSNYYYYWSDGTTSEYRKVSGDTKYKYVIQTMKPSDWSTNYGNYYIKNPSGSGYLANTKTKWKAKKFYTKKSYSVAPKWSSLKVYTKKVTKSSPTWEASTYYTASEETIIPAWVPNAYFQKVIDNYEELVEGGIETLNESLNCDSLEINLDPNEEYDIGDVVGANEQTTGISTWQQITKKIVTINSYITAISYKVGE